MLMGLLRVVAVLIGLALVLGGGVCTVAGVSTGLITWFSGSVAAGLSILFATAIGLVVLLIGLRLLKFGGASKPAETLVSTVTPDELYK